MTSQPSISGAAVLQSAFGPITPFTLDGLPYDLRAPINDPGRQAGTIDPDDPGEYRQPDSAQAGATSANPLVPSASGTGPLIGPGDLDPLVFVDGLGTMTRLSYEIMQRLCEDFVMLAGEGAEKAVYIRGRELLPMGRGGFELYVAQHYGELSIKKKGEDELVPFGAGRAWWSTSWWRRRVVRKIVMIPTAEPENQSAPEFNRWYVLKLEMVEPNLSATMADVKLLTGHLQHLAGGDMAPVVCFINTLAWMYQHPDDHVGILHFFCSPKGGAGKSLIYHILRRVFGESMVTECSGDTLKSKFGDAIDGQRLVVVNELSRSDKQDDYERLKNQTTESTVIYEGKGKAAKKVRNITQFIITSNHDDALPLMQNDRRVNVFLCNEPPKPQDYYEKLMAWIEGPGAAQFAGILARWEFPEGWTNYSHAPQTAAALKLQRIARGTLVNKFEELMEMGEAPFERDFVVVEEVCNKLKELPLAIECNSTTAGKALKTLCGDPVKVDITKSGKKQKRKLAMVYYIRNEEGWKSATPDQRAQHRETGERLPGMVEPGEEGAQP